MESKYIAHRYVSSLNKLNMTDFCGDLLVSTLIVIREKKKL